MAERHVVHVFENRDCRTELERVAEESCTPWPAKYSLNGQPAKIEPIARTIERHQHHQRAFMRLLVVMLVVRLAVEGLEDQPPGIERGQQRGDDGA